MYRPFTTLAKFNPKYFILFDANANGIFFISFSDCSLEVYRNIIDFFILVLYIVSYNLAEIAY